jgi:hypothetical protein
LLTSWERWKIDYCVGLERRNVREKAKTMFNLCDFTLCGLFKHNYSTNQGTSVFSYDKIIYYINNLTPKLG